MTGRDLVSTSLRLLGVVASGETPAAQEASDALSAFNRMLDSWSNEGLLVFQETQETPITLTGGTATVTLGAGGNLTTRPMEILRAAIRVGSSDFPVRIFSLDEYARIVSKSVQSNIPESLYDDGGYPQRTLTLYPVPSTGNSLVLWTKRPLSKIATLDTTLAFPPGYEEALVYNGAIRLAPEYGKGAPAEVVEIAIASKAAIKRSNSRPSYLRSDEALLGRSGRWNVVTGDYRR